MANNYITMDTRLQICFGIFAVFSLFAAIAGLNTHNSLGAVWIRCIRRRLRRGFLDRTAYANETSRVPNEEAGFELLRLDAVDIPSSRISFDDLALRRRDDLAVDLITGLRNQHHASQMEVIGP